jgi:hypothetical protein
MKITPIICGLGMLCFLIAMIAMVSWDVNSAVNSEAGFRDAQNKIHISDVFTWLGVGCFVIAFFTYIFEVSDSSTNKQDPESMTDKEWKEHCKIFYGSHTNVLEKQEESDAHKKFALGDFDKQQIPSRQRKSNKSNIFNVDVWTRACPKCKGTMIITRYGFQCKNCGYSDASKDYVS